VRGATRLPGARALGACGDEALSFRAGKLTGCEARAVGINWVLAPCLDVASNPKNPVIGPRAFSTDPTTVAVMGLAFARGLGAAGVLTCAKHFPGHGDVEIDPHLTLPTVLRSRERLEAEDWPPFRSAVAAGIDSVMSSHLRVVALDPEQPATLSRTILTGLLRDTWGYQGLIVSDALTMHAVSDLLDLEVRALAAGCDLLMMPADAGPARRRIVEAVREGRLPEGRVYEAVARVLALKARLVERPIDPLAIDRLADADLGSAIARCALRVVRDREALLPLAVAPLEILIVDRLATTDPDLLAEPRAPEHYWVGEDAPEAYLAFVAARATAASRVVVQVLTPVGAFRGTAAVHGAGERLLHALDGARTIAVSYAHPDLAERYSHLSTVLDAAAPGPAGRTAVRERLET
jgi:beta-glucosidase-like glycosyl hydrolase